MGVCTGSSLEPQGREPQWLSFDASNCTLPLERWGQARETFQASDLRLGARRSASFSL